jgi:tropomyosin
MSRLLAVFVVPHLCGRLRQVDIKAEHFERQVQRVEQERDTWTSKFEVCVTITERCITPQGRPTDRLSLTQEMEAKHRKSKAELDELVANMEGL